MYVAVSDFRTGTLKWYTAQLALDTTEAPDAYLTDAIAAFSDRIDFLTGDHFEPEPSNGDMTLDVDSDGGPHLYVPKRIRTLSAVAIRDSAGNLSTQDPSVYRVRASLAGGARQPGDLDIVELIPGQYLSWGVPSSGAVLANGYSTWPVGPQVVRLTGAFSWATTPERIKRAVALLVWDHFRAEGSDLHRAEEIDTSDATYHLAPTDDRRTGIPEVDGIVADFSRNRDTYF